MRGGKDMKVTQHIEAANGETLFSRNYSATKRESIQELYDNIDP
jgi:hypothetical protein